MTTASCEPKQKVLVIEDDLLQRKLVVNTLHRLGIDDVLEAGDSETTLGLIETSANGFDATICDLRLHMSDALDILSRSSKEKLGSIIILSGLPSDVMTASAQVLSRQGFDVRGCLPKPLNGLRLKSLLTQTNRETPPKIPQAPVRKNQAFTESEIMAALTTGQFVAHYQPKLTLQTRCLSGVEALCRWQHPEHGLLAPGLFVSLVEAYGLIDLLTERMLEQACQLITETRDYTHPLKVSVNLSADSLENHGAIQRLMAIVREAAVAPEQLIFELTESTLVKNDAQALELLTKLRIQGFGISLDDFGTGYTSLRQLRTLPVTELKLDRSFVTGAYASSRATHILDSVIGLAKHLHLNTVAEGIESDADAEFLEQRGCQEGQGYFLARPMPSDKLKRWM